MFGPVAKRNRNIRKKIVEKNKDNDTKINTIAHKVVRKLKKDGKS